MKRGNKNDKVAKKLTLEKQTIRELKPTELEKGTGGLRDDGDRTEPC